MTERKPPQLHVVKPGRPTVKERLDAAATRPQRPGAERDAELRERLKRLRFAFVRADPNPTQYERDVMTLVSVLASGDPNRARLAAEPVTSAWAKQSGDAHVDVLEHWTKELAKWDGQRDVAEQFIVDVVEKLRDYRGLVPPEYVATPERIEAVRVAFVKANGEKFKKDPGAVRVRKGLRAMGLGARVDTLFSNYRKARQK